MAGKAGRPPLSRIDWSRTARNDLLAIAEHYEAIAPDLADAMLERVVDAIEPLLTHPQLGPVVDSQGGRKWLVRGTPFALFYDVQGADIEIIRVRHLRENWRL